MSAAGGIKLAAQREHLRATLSTQKILSVDNQRYRNATGLTGEWLHALDELRLFTLSAQAVDLSYTGGNEVRDAMYYGAAAGYRGTRSCANTSR